MRKFVFVLLAACVIAGVTAYADSDTTAMPKPTTTPVEIAKETGLSDYDWQRIFEWETNGKKKYRGLSTREKFEYFYTLVSRGYFEDEKHEFLDNYEDAQNNSKSDVVLYLSENTLSNGKTLEDTWIYDTLKLEEWNDYVLFANRISDEKISEANGVYTFNIFSKVIEWAEQGGREAVTYKKNSNILPDQDIVITFDKNSNANSPSGTVSVIEEGEEIIRCNIIEVNSPTPQSYTYFFDMEKSEREAVEYQKENWGSWSENGKRYRYASINKKPKEIASFHFNSDVSGSEAADTVSADGSLTVDYYVLDPKIDSNLKHNVEVLVIGGDKGKSVYYKRSGFDLSVPTAQSVMLGGEMYVTIPYDKVTTYYENEENRDEYRIEVCSDENAFLTLTFGTYDKPEYKVQLDADDLHITKTYDEMTSYSENMPEYWHADAEGRFDSSPEGKRLLEEIGQEHTVYYASDNPQSTAAPIVTSDPPAPAKAPLKVAGGNKIEISVGNEKVTFPDAQPFIDENDRTQVPIRAVAEMLDCTVDWDKDTETAIITREDGRTATLTIGSDVMIVNNTETNIPVQMDTAAIIKDERTYIPIRFVAEAMGLKVEWEN